MSRLTTHCSFLLLSSAQVLLSMALLGPMATWAQTNPPVADPTHQAVDELIRQGRLQDALAMSHRLLEKQPRNAKARFTHAVLLADLGQTAEATQQLESLTQDFPELPEPHNNLAVLFARQGQYERAQAALQRAITSAPNYVTARENLADLYLAMAVESYRQAAELDPKSTRLQDKLTAARQLLSQLQSAPAAPPLAP